MRKRKDREEREELNHTFIERPWPMKTTRLTRLTQLRREHCEAAKLPEGDFPLHMLVSFCLIKDAKAFDFSQD